MANGMPTCMAVPPEAEVRSDDLASVGRKRGHAAVKIVLGQELRVTSLESQSSRGYHDWDESESCPWECCCLECYHLPQNTVEMQSECRHFQSLWVLPSFTYVADLAIKKKSNYEAPVDLVEVRASFLVCKKKTARTENFR